MRTLSAGVPYVEIVERFTRLAREDLPPAFAALAVITRQHLVAQRRGTGRRSAGSPWPTATW
jgi:hypothetical protein